MTVAVATRDCAVSPHGPHDPSRPMVAVVEPDARVRSGLVAVLGPGVASLTTVTELSGVLGDSASGRRAGQVASVVVVTGPSVPLRAAAAIASRHISVGSVGGWWRVAVVGVARRCGTTALRDALDLGLCDLLGSDAGADQLRHAVRRAGLDLVVRQMPLVHGTSGTDSGIPVGGGPIAVFAPKGGAGASTVAVNVAVGLAARSTGTSSNQWRYPAVLIDADLQFGDLALMLGIDPMDSLASFSPAKDHPRRSLLGDNSGLAAHSIARDSAESGAFEDLVASHRRSGVALLGAPVDPALADTVPAGRVIEAIDAIGVSTPWLVVDLPSHIGDLTLDVIDRSRHLLVVTGTDPSSVKDARIVADTLTRLGVGTERWTLVCNGAHGSGGLSITSIEQHVGVSAGAVIPVDPAVPQSLLRGNPVVLESPGSAAAVAFASLVDRLVGADQQSPPPWPAVTAVARAERLRQRVLTTARAAVSRRKA